MKSSLKIVMVGAPGSGKGTQASRMTKELNIPHISTGEIFREYIANKHPLGNKIKEFPEGTFAFLGSDGRCCRLNVYHVLILIALFSALRHSVLLLFLSIVRL